MSDEREVGNNGPPPGSEEARTVPLHVLSEERERRRQLEREMELLKDVVMEMRKSNQPQSQQTQNYDEYIEKFDDDTRKGIDAFIEKKLNAERQAVGPIINGLLHKSDMLEYKLVAGSQADAYAKKVEAEVAEYKRNGMAVPPRSVIFSNLKIKEQAEKFSRMERESRSRAEDVYGREYVQDNTRREHDYYSDLNDSSGGAPVKPKPRKSFKEMTLAEKEAALAEIEL